MENLGCRRVVRMVVLGFWAIIAGLAAIGAIANAVLYERVEGEVVDLIRGFDEADNVRYTPVYEYEVDGFSYSLVSESDYAEGRAPAVGDRIELVYDPGDPGDAEERDVFVQVGAPLIFAVISILAIALILWRAKRRELALRQPLPPMALPQLETLASGAMPGQRATIDAMFMGAEPSQMDGRGRVRYRVKARAEIDGEIHRFLSDFVEEDPTLLYMQLGNKVEVRIDPNDPSVYEVVVAENM